MTTYILAFALKTFILFRTEHNFINNYTSHAMQRWRDR